MTITSITIENFKGIKEPVQVEFKPITLLFGPNSAGKSTIIQALHYTKEIFERENVDPGKTTIGGKTFDLGGFNKLVYNHDLNRSIILKFEMDLEDEDLPAYVPEEYISAGTPYLDELHEASMHASQTVQSAWVEIKISWSSWLKKPFVEAYEVGINGNILARISCSKDGRQVELSYYDWEFTGHEDIDVEIQDECNDFSSKAINIYGQRSALPCWDKPLDLEISVKHSDLSDENDPRGMLRYAIDYGLSKMHTWVVGPGQILRDALQNFYYLGPLREIPQRNFEPARSPDESRWASGIMAWDTLYKAEKNFIKEVNRWLSQKDRLNSGYRIEVKRFREIGETDPISVFMSEGIGLEEMEMIQSRMSEIPIKSRVVIREEKTGIELMPQDVGVGISQVLPVIISSLHVQEGIFAIEQPELHIHPAFQVALGDLFISQIQKKDVYFLLETHSEHLMLRFLRRIRETNEDNLPPGKDPLRPDQLAVYYVQQDETGVSVLPIRISEDGEFIDSWPKGFFEEREEELLY